MRTPDFLIIGAPKAGTTTLWHIFNSHPDIFMSPIKEPMYFSHAEQWGKGWDWYSNLFADVGPQQIAGEASPHYSVIDCFPEAPQRIADCMPGVKLIYSIRHPIHTLESAWKQFLHSGQTMPQRESMPLEFNRAIMEYPPLLAIVKYWSNLEAYRQFFPDSQILVIAFEEWTQDPDQTLHRCWEFLGVGDVGNISRAIANESAGKTMFRPQIAALRRIPAIDWLRQRLPRQTKQRIRAMTRMPVPHRMTWTPDAREYVSRSLANQSTKILEYANYSPTFWDLPREAFTP